MKNIPSNKNLRKLDLHKVRIDPSELLQPGEMGICIFDKVTAEKLVEAVFTSASLQEALQALPKKNCVMGTFAGSPDEIMAEMDVQKKDGRYTVSIFSCTPDDIKTIRPITYGDISEEGLSLRINEAAIIVTNLERAKLAKFNPMINPFVSAYAGHESLIQAEKKKYEGDPKYRVDYWPAEIE